MTLRASQLLKWIVGLLIFGGVVFGMSHVALAQDATTSLDTVATTAGIQTGTDVRVIIGNIINVVLSFLGIIAIIIVLYGGFTWMTAGGDADKVDRAKKILINGVIGLTVIFLSWAITAFVLNALIQSTGVGSGSTGTNDGGPGGGGLGGSPSTSFAVADVVPQGDVAIRNIQVQTTFSKLVDPASVTDATFQVIRVSDGIDVVGTRTVSGNKITFVPDDACPDPNGDRKCFDANSSYEIRIHIDLQSTSGTNLLGCAPTCSYFFTSGEIIDTENPDVTFTLPDNGERVPSDSVVDVQAESTDDFRVGTTDFYVADTFFDSIAASGADLSDVIAQTLWDTQSPVATQIGERYTLRATVTDLAGNTANDSISVTMSPAYCFNGQLDSAETPPEEGIDCGGLCGACDGSVCTQDSDCAGSCINGLCVAQPVITDVSPRDGAPGTLVTISGSDFRSTTGVVYFSDGAGGQVAATVAACSNGWGNDEIVVEVPAGAADGPIAVETSTGLVDATNDAIGPLVEDFDVTDTVRPGICKLSPSNGNVGASVDVIGQGFGTTQDLVQFISSTGSATDVRTYSDWADTSVNITVPSVSEGSYDVQVSVGGVTSNTVRFNVRDRGLNAPTISSIDPESGGIGQYITLFGNDFGTTPGIVWFENTTDGTTEIADTSFPAACGNDYWNDHQVTVKVPSVATDSYNIYIARQIDGEESNRMPFVVSTESAHPGICAINPVSGTTGDNVTIIGENFGSPAGSVRFYNDVPALVGSWSSNEITATVPSGATTGPVTVRNASSVPSNTVNFELTGGSSASLQPAGAMYAWTFSTGQIPVTPHVIQSCNDQYVSAVPNEVYNDAVCVNAVGFASFDTLMDESTINGSTVILDRCSDANCGSTTSIQTELTVTSAADKTAFLMRPLTQNQRLAPNTTYRITVTTGVQSIDGTPLDAPVSWKFTTDASSADCDIEEVRVHPSTQTLTAEGQTTEYNALPIAQQCIVLHADDYSWNWSVNGSVASITEGCANEPGDSCATAEALAEGQTPVTARSDSGVSGRGDLTVNFTDPYVDNYWPDCTDACINADVGASFNIPMDEVSVEAPGAVSLYGCDNEFCVNLSLVSNRATCIDEGNGCTRISIRKYANLDVHKYYRVVVSGDVRSESGVALTRLNYGNDYSWTFLTRADSTECTVSRIDLEPGEAVLKTVGETQQFTATPYGEVDSCSVAGQRLNGFDYAWNWTDPIDNSSQTDADIASWVKIDGSLFDANQDGIPDGCTNSCISSGSQAVAALCGNRVVEVGEDCDDGNTLIGDGCSDSCQFEGAPSCALGCSNSGAACTNDNDCDRASGEYCAIVGAGCCGDGVVSGAEECDDSNLVNGDGCSAQCVNEGSRAAGVTCGDGIVSHDPVFGGEDCDDGNRSNGDGCSSECLNEGSPRFSDIGAICGNGRIEVPYETCDDGNAVNGDGCSARCVREGSVGQSVTGFDCGNGSVERISGSNAGEDCDGGEGCSATCTFEGSSLTYSSPSVCGDGIPGVGEFPLCEVGLSGDGNVDPIQLAQIDDDAAAQVDDSGKATQSIEVGLNDLNITADLTLLCTAQSDSDCPAGFGVDQNGCCSERPDVSLFPNGSNVCLNASVYAISTKEMDANSFNGNAYVRYDGAGACPAGHTLVAFNPSEKLLARLWNRFTSMFVLSAHAQVSGECVVPVQRFTQTKTETGDYKITFSTSVLLEPSSPYTIVLEDGTEGVLTKSGVSLGGGQSVSFTTGTEVCALDEVSVQDQTGPTPGLFTRFDDQHDMLAVPYSLNGPVRQEIQPVPGVYEWNWSAWQEDSGGSLFTLNSASADQVTVAPTGDNGEANLVAQAEVIENGSPTGTVAGQKHLTAFLCENPWPSASYFPFEDSQDGYDRGIPGLSPDPAWMNFSSYYCRDTDDTTVQLPELSVVSSANPGSDAVIKEYFFAVGASSDVIGIRVASNDEYLSPLAWYQAQGFTGAPQQTTVDGFAAVKEGRTMYVAAPNEDVTNGRLYSNIYVISYNEGASANTINIYNQLLDNWSFVINVDNVNLCHNGTAYTGTVCASDLDCNAGAGEVCAAQRDKLRRDTQRLADLNTIQASLERYGGSNRLCSVTTTQSCSSTSDCPSAETCRPSYPTLPSGTYIRSLTSSVWSSWGEELGTFTGSLPQDPLNRYAECGEGTANPDYSADTCVNESLGTYICPVESYAYHYQARGTFGYNLSADLEYTSAANSIWVNPIDANTTDEKQIEVGRAVAGSGSGFVTSASFCDGTVYGNSDVCGDGVLGSGEYCEIGQRGPGVVCQTTDGAAGYQPSICNATCTGFGVEASTSCVAYSCGNGVREGSEVCDDGSLNGDYGFCNAECSGYDFFCGDGSLAGGEACDCSATGASGLTVGRNVCTVSNGVYQSNPNNSCAWDCSGPASYCGDGIVDSGEQCDGNSDTWTGALCRSGSNKGMPCSTDADCSGGACGATPSGAKAWAAACENTTVCLSGANEGIACSTDTDCPGSTCSSFNVQTERTRSCADNGAAGDVCTWNETTWQNIACKAPGSCGDGVLDAGEQCDDGNDSNADGCTNFCTVNVCGDGYVQAGVEQCDEGSDNVQMCTSAYGSVCTYCSSSCTLLSSSGSFCGDGVRNGNEFCDGGDLPLYWYNGLDANGVCYEAGAQSNFMTCSNVGVCNGGVDYIGGSGSGIELALSLNGQTCLTSADCGGGTCVFPTCAANCQSSCPFNYDNVQLQLLDNQVGAVRSSSANLLSSTETETARVLGAPNAANLYLSECRALDDVVADIDESNRQYPNVEVMFVLDISQSMNNTMDSGESRLAVLRDAVTEATTELFQSYDSVAGATMSIGLAYIGNEHGTDLNGDGQYQANELTDFVDLSPTSNEATVNTAINSLLGAAAPDTGTPIYESIKDASNAFSGRADVEYIVVFTDGNIYNATSDYNKLNFNLIDTTDENGNGTVDNFEYMKGVSNLTDDIQASGVKMFTAVLGDGSTCNAQQMERWSNMQCTASAEGCNGPTIEGNYLCSIGEDGIKYAYSGETAAELRRMYSEIVDTILNVTISVTYDGETAHSLVRGTTAVPIPIPATVSCDQFNEQDLIVKFSFADRGPGTVGISNVRADMCSE